LPGGLPARTQIYGVREARVAIGAAC
jgi:hypothetical protein